MNSENPTKGFLSYTGTVLSAAVVTMLGVHMWQTYVQRPRPQTPVVQLSGPQNASGRFEMLEPRPGEAYRVKFANGICAYRTAVDTFEGKIMQALEKARAVDASIFESGTVKGTGTGPCISIDSFLVQDKDITK